MDHAVRFPARIILFATVTQSNNAEWSIAILIGGQLSQTLWIRIPVNFDAVSQFVERPRLPGPFHADIVVVLKIIPACWPLVFIVFQVFNHHAADPPDRVHVPHATVD